MGGGREEGLDGWVVQEHGPVNDGVSALRCVLCAGER